MSKAVVSTHETAHGSVKSYSLGFGLSLLLTLAAYFIASKQVTEGWTMVYVLAVLAVSQLFVQLYFFLHVGRESRPRWNTAVLAFAAMVVFIVVFGSLWIMKNLNYSHTHTGSPVNESSERIIKDEGY
jgi:cytochrome o ubiquinol oxidase operon protein cyoD